MLLFYLALLAVTSATVPTAVPTTVPTAVPTTTTDTPTVTPTAVPTTTTDTPTETPTTTTSVPTDTPTSTPTPAIVTTNSPTAVPTSGGPTTTTSVPTDTPTETPTGVPTHTPTNSPTETPTGAPTPLPTIDPGDLSALMCTCQDNGDGHWMTEEPVKYTPCLLCADGWSGAKCNVRACTATQCGNGVCNIDGPGCVCNAGWAGNNCDVCAPNFWGPTCNIAYDCTADSCNQHGECVGLDKLVKGCGTMSFDPAAGESCCPYVTEGQYVAEEWVYPGELAQYSVAGEFETCCGPSVCGYEETCVNKELGICCKDVEEACSLQHENETSSATRANEVQCCARGSKCCDGKCCSAFQACVTLPPKATGWKDDFGEPIEKKDRQKVCSAESAGFFSGSAVARVFIVPIGCLLGGVLTLLAMCKANVSGGMKATGSLAVFASILLLASQWWTRGLLAIVGVFLTMLFSGPEWSRWPRFTALAVQTTVLFVIAIFPDNYKSIFGISNTRRGPWAQMNMNAMLEGCKDYFGYFYREDQLKTWNAHPDFGNYFGFCSITWQTVELAVVMVLVCALILFLVTTLLDLLESPEPVPKLASGGPPPVAQTNQTGGPPPVTNQTGGPPPSGGTGDEVEMQSQPVGHTVERDDAGIFQVQQS